jgi:hypothetical protein
MDLIDLYASQVEKENADYSREFRICTRITSVTIEADNALLFRFETSLFGIGGPACQYVIYRNGQLHFLEKGQWFIPGDVLFNSLGDLVDYCKGEPIE